MYIIVRKLYLVTAVLFQTKWNFLVTQVILPPNPRKINRVIATVYILTTCFRQLNNTRSIDVGI